MKTERGFGSSHHFSEKYLDGFLSLPSSNGNGYGALTISTSSSSSNSLPSSPGVGNYIAHRFSKMDTLTGDAIKYRVEVADIRRMNGLVMDLQMFALKSLRIPLPGRHPPSPVLSNGSAANGLLNGNRLIDSLPSKLYELNILSELHIDEGLQYYTLKRGALQVRVESHHKTDGTPLRAPTLEI